MRIFVYITLLSCCTFPLLSQNDLSYYINTARQNSPLINDNQTQSKVSQLEADRLKALYTKPQIGITANYLFSPIINLDDNTTKFEANSAGATNYLGYDFAAANGGQYQALLNINQPLFNGQKLKIVSEQTTIASEINRNNVKLTGHDIEKLVTDQYILCLQDSKQNEYAKGMLELLSEQKTVIQKLVAASIYKQSDLTLLNIEYQNFLLQSATYTAVYRRDLMDLNILCGINDTSLVGLKNIDLKPAASAQNSLFNEKYRLDSLNLVAAKNIFELKYRPQFSAIANTGLNAVYAPTIPSRFGANAGFTFTYNFFDGKQKYINRNKTDLLLKSVSFYRDNFITQNTVRKAKIMNELNSYTDRISITQQQLKDYDILLSQYKKEILTGQLSVINYVITLKNMATMQRDNSLLSTQQQLLINAYNFWNW
jgi:outer membrane protein TolC